MDKIFGPGPKNLAYVELNLIPKITLKVGKTYKKLFESIGELAQIALSSKNPWGGKAHKVHSTFTSEFSEHIFPILARLKRAQEENSRLLGLKSQRVSLGMPTEVGFEEQNIGEKGTSERVVKNLHSNFPQMAGQLLNRECARQSWRNE